MNRSDVNHPDVIVGELTLFNGQRQGNVTHMGLLTPPRRAHGDRRSETLLIFLDLGGGGASGVAKAMLEHFDRTFWRCSGPVTSALQKAVSAANAHLREENRLMPISQRRRGGLICAVLRDDQVFLSQIGPGKALLVQNGEVECFPVRSDDRLPLGVAIGIDIQFAHYSIGGGDRLLLTGDNWIEAVPDNALVEALAADDVGDVLLALEQEVGDRSVSVIVAECCPLPDSAEPVAPQNQEAHAQDTEPSEMLAAQQLPLAPVGRADPQREVTTKPAAYQAVAQPQSSGERLPQQARSQYEAMPELGSPVEMMSVGDAADSAGSTGGWRPNVPLVGLAYGREQWGRSRRRLRRASAVFASSARAAIKRVLPEPDPTLTRPRQHAKASSGDNVPIMAGIAAALPVLIAFIVVTLYLQRGAIERESRVVNQARQSFEAAQLVQGEAAHVTLASALQDVDAALVIQPGNGDLAAMRTEILRRLDELQTVIRPAPELLWDFGAGRGRRLVATRTQVFLLDTTQGEVYLLTLDHTGQSTEGEAPTLVVDSTQTVGDTVVGGLKDLLWLNAAGAWTGDALLVLTTDNRLLQHNLSWGLSWMPFDGETVAGNVRALRPYDGRIYALSPDQDQIWRFLYDGVGFDSAEAYFSVPAPDLTGAADMAIDGAIYILLEDGRIFKFVGGRPEPYSIEDLPQPLDRPVAIASEGGMMGGALYVADAATQSIVALTKGGEFLHQIRADDEAFANLEALAIDEDSRTLFVLANGRLYALALPSVPAPPSEP
jgi:hypothetical protein